MLPVLANPVNAETDSGTISTKQGIMEYISGTYFYRRLFANPNFYGLENPSEEALITLLTNVVDQVMADLVESKCIIIDEEENSIMSSPFGRLASIYYLKHETIRYLLNEFTESTSIEEALMTLSHCPEYSEIPVRHNEELENAQFQKKLKIRFPTNVLDSSNTKAHLLFQAQFSQTNITCDYRTDKKSVLDQFMRILQAMCEVCALNGWTSSVLSCVILQQMCYTGRWYDDHPLLSLPLLNENECNRIGNGITIPLLKVKLAGSKSENINGVLKQAQKELSSLSFSKEHRDKIVKSLCSYPILNVRRCELFCNNENISIALNSGTYNKLKASSVCRLVLQLNTMGCCKSNDIANLPQWSKEKTTGWIILISGASSSKLLCLSYSGPIEEQRIVRMRVPVPEKRGKYS